MRIRIKAKNIFKGDVIQGKKPARVKVKYSHGDSVLVVIHKNNRPYSMTFNQDDYVKVDRPKYNQERKVRIKSKDKPEKEKLVEVENDPNQLNLFEDDIVSQRLEESESEELKNARETYYSNSFK
jgi:hypothetical protein